MFHIRLLSVLGGTLSIAVFYAISRHLYRPGLGLLSAFLLAVSPIHIWYSQEARMYVFLALLTMLSAYFTWRLSTNLGRSLWLGYGLVTLLALYAHYFTLFAMLFENAFIMIASFWRKQRSFVIKWLATQGILFFGFLPWLPTLYYQVKYHHMGWIPCAGLDSIRNTLLHLSLGIEWSNKVEAYLGLVWLSFMALIAVFALFKRKEKATLFVSLWFALPFLVITGISLYYPIYQTKQFLLLVPPLLLLIAMSVDTIRPWSFVAFLALLTLMCPALYKQYFEQPKQQWREVAQYIDTHAQPGDMIYLNPAAGALTLDYYLKSNIPQEGYPPTYGISKGGFEGSIVTPEFVEARFRSLARKYRRIWLIQYSAYIWDPHGLIPAWLNEHGPLVRTPSFFGIDFRLYELVRDEG